MATQAATPITSPAMGESQIFISSATLKLKQNFDDFQWHTEVITPPDMPSAEEEVLPTHVRPTEATPPQQPEEQQPHSKDLYTPATTFAEPDTVFTSVGKFMDAERYHSEWNWLINHSLVHKRGGDVNSTEV